MMLRSFRFAALLLVLTGVAMPGATAAFDHGYSDYAQLLARHVDGSRVSYAALKADRGALDRVVAQFEAPDAQGEGGWTREQRMAFWINAYNAFTLRAIVDAYPIQSRWFTRQPRNSIRQIPDVWTTQRWRAARRAVSLDDIEHRVLRPIFQDARVHFAVNCASVSCPPWRPNPIAPTRSMRSWTPPHAATWRARKAFVWTATHCACPASSRGTARTSLPSTV
ncbi:MAG: DUF547 domain-containing protein, partial [Actinobacteria bacterium]|nr:DUF547 domain-containing protein [Actinomycetota bacterium]